MVFPLSLQVVYESINQPVGDEEACAKDDRQERTGERPKLLPSDEDPDAHDKTANNDSPVHLFTVEAGMISTRFLRIVSEGCYYPDTHKTVDESEETEIEASVERPPITHYIRG
jgi:hypothetical protein